jgi:hypothetical protein
MLEVSDRDRADRRDGARPREQAALIQQLSAIREELLEVAEGWRPWVEGRAADRDASARNLLQYLALRRHDLRELQFPLIALGLSSLGGSEGHVQASVDAVPDALSTLAHRPPPAPSGSAPIGFAHSRDLLALRTEALLGPAFARAANANHGDDAQRSGERAGLGARDARRRDGLHEDQLCPRCRAAVAHDAREPAPG